MQSGEQPAGETLECPLCQSILEGRSLRFLRLHLKKTHPGANIYDVKFVSLVNFLKEYKHGENAYRVIRNLR